jgi:hypothetical protein
VIVFLLPGKQEDKALADTKRWGVLLFVRLYKMCGDTTSCEICDFSNALNGMLNGDNLNVSASGYARFLVDALVFGVDNAPKLMI